LVWFGYVIYFSIVVVVDVVVVFLYITRELLCHTCHTKFSVYLYSFISVRNELESVPIPHMTCTRFLRNETTLVMSKTTKEKKTQTHSK